MSSQLHAANVFFTQAQPAVFAHSGSQPQAGPPGALSSQYQPFGHRASPQGEQVPSSQVARFGAGAALASPSSLGSAAARAWLCEVEAAEVEVAFWACGAPPPQPTKQSAIKKGKRRKLLRCIAAVR